MNSITLSIARMYIRRRKNMSESTSNNNKDTEKEATLEKHQITKWHQVYTHTYIWFSYNYYLTLSLCLLSLNALKIIYGWIDSWNTHYSYMLQKIKSERKYI